MEIFEDADLKCAVVCEAQGLIVKVSVWDDSRKRPACEQDKRECCRDQHDAGISFSPGTSPHGVFHGFYAVHLELVLAGASLIRDVSARRVSEALRCLHMVVISGRRLMDEEWPVKGCTWRRKWGSKGMYPKIEYHFA